MGRRLIGGASLPYSFVFCSGWECITLQLEGFEIVDFDTQPSTIAIQLIHLVMDSGQTDVRGMEMIFEQAVLEAREILLETIYE